MPAAAEGINLQITSCLNKHAAINTSDNTVSNVAVPAKTRKKECSQFTAYCTGYVKQKSVR